MDNIIEGVPQERLIYITACKAGTIDQRYYHLYDSEKNMLWTFKVKFDAMMFAHTTFGTAVVNPTSLKAFIAKKMIWLPNDGTPSYFDSDTFTFTGEAPEPGGQHWRLDVWHYIKTAKLALIPSTDALEDARKALGIPKPYTPISDRDLQIQIITNFFTLSHMTEATGKASGLRWLTTLELQQYIELYAQRYLGDLIDPNTLPRQIDKQLILIVALALGFQSGFVANSSNKNYRLFSAVGGVALPYPLSGAVFDYSQPSYINSVPDRINSNRLKSEPHDKRFMLPKHDIKADIALWRRIEAQRDA